MWTAFTKLRLALMICLTIMPAMIVTAQDDSGEISIENDVLVYSTYNSSTRLLSLMLYDPSTDESTTIFESDSPISFAIAPDGRVAVSTSEDRSIVVFDVANLDQSPLPLGETFDFYGIPVSWSPDGQYLAFMSPSSETLSIFFWEDETIADITLNDIDAAITGYNATTWSNDGRLAFITWFDFSATVYGSEIYVWDGQTTVNLSQNLDGFDHAPAWNDNGELAFLSEREGDYDILVWDGVSMRDGSPDADSYTNIIPELTDNHSLPVWTPDGNLAFSAQSEDDPHIQIYLWNGEKATNISQNPDYNNSMPIWNNTGLWAFATYFSFEGTFVYVRDANNQTLLATEGFGRSWDSNGNLIFCKTAEQGRGVYLWDGENIRQIIAGWEIYMKWQSGGGLSCTSG